MGFAEGAPPLISNPPVVTDVEISSTARSRRRKPLRYAILAAGSVVTVLVSAVLPSARPAGADTVGTERAQAAQVSAELQADEAKLDALSQQYELAQQQLSSIQGQMSEVRATIATDESQVVTDQSALRAEALQNYESGAGTSGFDAEFGQSGEQAAVTQEYSSLAAGDITDAVDDLRLAQARLAQQQSQLQTGESQAQQALAQIASAQAAAQATTDAENATLSSLNEAVSDLVAQQEAGDRADLGGATFGNPPPNGAAGVAVRAAESQIGVPYEWGEEDPGHGFDCSGLTQWSWGQAGVSIPRTANDQYDAVARVPLADLEPGDLVFWGSDGYAEHVGMYVGNGDVVDAPSSGQDVQIQPIWSDGLLGAGRP